MRIFCNITPALNITRRISCNYNARRYTSLVQIVQCNRSHYNGNLWPTNMALRKFSNEDKSIDKQPGKSSESTEVNADNGNALLPVALIDLNPLSSTSIKILLFPLNWSNGDETTIKNTLTSIFSQRKNIKQIEAFSNALGQIPEFQQSFKPQTGEKLQENNRAEEREQSLNVDDTHGAQLKLEKVSELSVLEKPANLSLVPYQPTPCGNLFGFPENLNEALQNIGFILNEKLQHSTSPYSLSDKMDSNSGNVSCRKGQPISLTVVMNSDALKLNFDEFVFQRKISYDPLNFGTRAFCTRFIDDINQSELKTAKIYEVQDPLKFRLNKKPTKTDRINASLYPRHISNDIPTFKKSNPLSSKIRHISSHTPSAKVTLYNSPFVSELLGGQNHPMSCDTYKKALIKAEKLRAALKDRVHIKRLKGCIPNSPTIMTTPKTPTLNEFSDSTDKLAKDSYKNTSKFPDLGTLKSHKNAEVNINRRISLKGCVSPECKNQDLIKGSCQNANSGENVYLEVFGMHKLSSKHMKPVIRMSKAGIGKGGAAGACGNVGKGGPGGKGSSSAGGSKGGGKGKGDGDKGKYRNPNPCTAVEGEYKPKCNTDPCSNLSDPCKKPAQKSPGSDKKNSPCPKKEDKKISAPCTTKDDKKKSDPCVKKENPSKSCTLDKKQSGPCIKKYDKKKPGPCAKKDDKKKSDPCAKKDKKNSGPCAKKDDKKKSNPCVKKDDKKKADPCAKKDEKKKSDSCVKKDDKKKPDPCAKKDVKKCPCDKKDDKKKTDPCAKKDEKKPIDPCAKKEKKTDPCAKKDDKKKLDPCGKNKEKKPDPCGKDKKKIEKKKSDPCIKEDENKKSDPCAKDKKKKPDPCAKQEKKKADPCAKQKKTDAKQEKNIYDPCVKTEKKTTDPCAKQQKKTQDFCDKQPKKPSDKQEIKIYDPCAKKQKKTLDPCAKKSKSICKPQEQPTKKCFSTTAVCQSQVDLKPKVKYFSTLAFSSPKIFSEHRNKIHFDTNWRNRTLNNNLKYFGFMRHFSSKSKNNKKNIDQGKSSKCKSLATKKPPNRRPNINPHPKDGLRLCYPDYDMECPRKLCKDPKKTACSKYAFLKDTDNDKRKENENFVNRCLRLLFPSTTLIQTLKRQFHTSFGWSRNFFPKDLQFLQETDRQSHMSANIDEKEKSSQSHGLFNEALSIKKAYKVEHVIKDIPLFSDYDVLVSTSTIAISDSDIHIFENGNDSCPDITLGHDAAGVVVKTGQYITELKPGDRVAMEPSVACGICEFCKRGEYNMCYKLLYNGFFVKYQAHPADLCHKIPDTLSMAEGSLSQTLALGCQAVSKANITPSSNILIMGSGPTAVASAFCAYAKGAKDVVLMCTLREALESMSDNLSLKCIHYKAGFNFQEVLETIFNSFNDWPDVVVNCAINEETMNIAAMALKPCGICILTQCDTECVSFNALDVLMKNIQFVPSFRSANMFPTAIQLMSSGCVPMSKIIASSFHWDNVAEAFRAAQHESNSGYQKVFVEFRDKGSNYKGNEW